MGLYLGIDTSNYTTSAALYDSASGQLRMEKQPLPVRKGECGLRQSDAVFLHVRQLAGLLEHLLDGSTAPLDGVGYSAFPRRAEGSYMPCFLAGGLAARAVAAAQHLPCEEFSHQEGHIAAALYSAGCLDWLSGEFYAFHVSGGTTEALLVRADGPAMQVRVLGQTRDLNAGQAVDRVGVMLGCSFPCGPELEQLAQACTEPVRGKAALKGCDCCLSGVQNQCEALYQKGASKEYVAKYCLSCVEAAIAGMTREIYHLWGERPLLYAGGVMSNALIREELSRKFPGARFAAPAYSADNSAGLAVLAARKAALEQGEGC